MDDTAAGGEFLLVSYCVGIKGCLMLTWQLEVGIVCSKPPYTSRTQEEAVDNDSSPASTFSIFTTRHSLYCSIPSSQPLLYWTASLPQHADDQQPANKPMQALRRSNESHISFCSPPSALPCLNSSCGITPKFHFAIELEARGIRRAQNVPLR